jgi:CBS domain-containing protein
LDVAGLVTVPDFEGAYLDSEIEFRLPDSAAPGDGLAITINIPAPGESPVPTDLTEAVAALALLGGGVPDPTYRIGKLAAANHRPVSVGVETSLEEAATLMLMHDYSQLPVMQGERTLKGMVTWQSLGSRLALGQTAAKVRDFMVSAVELSADASLFAAIAVIVEHEAVLIRGSDQKVTGIVTTTDLSLQFRQLAEPFLLLGEIENHIRRLIDGKFTSEEVKSVCDPGDTGRDVQSVADLTFGEYVRLLENPGQWGKLHLHVDRNSFVKQLDRVREIRNNVMHFDPDGVADEELLTLRKFVLFLQTLQAIGAT